MILINQIITDIRIESVNDLYKLKPFLEDGTLKINKSQIARELEVDRRTVFVHKYLYYSNLIILTSSCNEINRKAFMNRKSFRLS